GFVPWNRTSHDYQNETRLRISLKVPQVVFSSLLFSRDQSMNKQPADGKTQLAYIVSASHSGSTLLAMLLGCQEGACTAGELRAPSIHNPESYKCSCGEPISSCDFWARIRVAMANRGFNNFEIT